MKGPTAILAILGVLLFSPAFVEAVPYTYVMGPTSSIDTTGTSSFLEMQATINPNLNNLMFSLDVGNSYTFAFARIYTTETWINSDDLNPGSITAYVSFANPDITQRIGGTSIGFRGAFNFNQGWRLTWGGPVNVDFADGGQFTIQLSDATHSNGWWSGPGGSEWITGTVTHNSNPVPEPSTAFLLGSGLLGLVGYGRKKVFKR